MTASVDKEHARATLFRDEPTAAGAPIAALSGEATEPAPPTPPSIPPSGEEATLLSTEPEDPPGVASQLDADGVKPEAAEAQPETLAVTVATAVQAAAFKMMPFRLGCALCVAVVVVSEDWDAPVAVPPVWNVILANLILILSSAWMLFKEPSTCKSILRQLQMRGASATSGDWYYDLASKVLRTPAWAMKVFVTLAYAAYIDSGSYLAAAVIIYVLRASPAAVGVDRGAEEAGQNMLDAALDGTASHSEL